MDRQKVDPKEQEKVQVPSAGTSLQSFSDLESDIKELNAQAYKALVAESGVIDVSLLQQPEYVGHLSPQIKRDLTPYKNLLAACVEYRTMTNNSLSQKPTQYNSQTLADAPNVLSTVTGDAHAPAPPVTQQQSKRMDFNSSTYKHPMLHLYDVAMQQQQKEINYGDVSSSNSETDSDSNDDTDSDAMKQFSESVKQQVQPVELVIPKTMPITNTITVANNAAAVPSCFAETRPSDYSVPNTLVSERNTCGLGGLTDTKKSRYDCNTCGNCFIIHCSDTGHKIEDSDRSSFICEFCRCSFADIELLKLHVQLHFDKNGSLDLSRQLANTQYNQDSQVSPFVCVVCGQEFKSQTDFARHEKTHDTLKPYGCAYCKQKFAKLQSLTVHVCRGAADFPCQFCGKVFNTESALHSHMELNHKSSASFKCHICNVGFDDNEQLNRHLNSHTTGSTVEANSIESDSATDVTTISGSDDDDGNGRFNHKSPKPSTDTPIVGDNISEKLEDHIGKFTEVTKSGGLICVICNESFKYHTEMKAHIRKHLLDELKSTTNQTKVKNDVEIKDEAYTCDKCDETFSTLNLLGIHIDTMHLQEGDNTVSLKCRNSVGDRFSNKKLSKHHLKKRERKNCSKRKAVAAAAKSVNLKCKICGRKFKDAVNLRRHGIVHSDNKQFTCSYCGKSFTRPDGLRAHVRTHTGEKPYKCMVCGVTCTTSSGLNIHKKRHTNSKPFTCHICGKLYKYRLSLNLHLMTHSASKPYTCDACDKSFYDPSSFKKHKVIHTGVKSHICEICGNSFFHRESLTKHIKTHNPNYTRKEHPCGQCKKVYNTASGLAIHQRTHTGEKPFECSQCSRYFATKSTLLSHSRTHSGEKPYGCQICGKRFIQATPLKMHMSRVHYTALFLSTETSERK